MANVKLSALTLIADAAITATDIFPGTDADAGTPTTYKFQLQQIRSALLAASGAGWDTTDYFGMGAGTIPASGMIRVGQGALAGASSPLINSTATWNNAATVFTHILVQITNTASNATSLLMDLQAGGAGNTSMWKVTALGAVTQAAGLTVTTGGVTVSAGTTAVQALSATTGTFTGAGSFANAGAALVLNNSAAPANWNAILQAQRGGSLRWSLGCDSGDSFSLINVAGNAVNLLVTDAGNVTARAILATYTSLCIDPTQKFFIDGVNAGGDTYITEVSGNLIDVVAGGNAMLRLATEGGRLYAAFYPSWIGAPVANVGSRVILIPNCLTAPTASQANTGTLYVEAGALKYRGAGGTMTTLALT